MTRPTDMLRFTGGPAQLFEVGWTGPWPPPERLTLAHGSGTGITKVIPDGYDVTPLNEAPTITLTTYRRKAASVLPDDFDGPVIRGAEYVPE